MINSYLYTLITSMTPISELRGAISLGISLGLKAAVAAVISVLGNAFVVPFLLLLIEPLFERLKTLTKLRNWIERYEERGSNQNEVWLQGRETKISNILSNFFLMDNLESYSNNNLEDQNNVLSKILEF